MFQERSSSLTLSTIRAAREGVNYSQGLGQDGGSRLEVMVMTLDPRCTRSIIRHLEKNIRTVHQFG
jgi:hypothetical protein